MLEAWRRVQRVAGNKSSCLKARGVLSVTDCYSWSPFIDVSGSPAVGGPEKDELRVSKVAPFFNLRTPFHQNLNKQTEAPTPGDRASSGF